MAQTSVISSQQFIQGIISNKEFEKETYPFYYEDIFNTYNEEEEEEIIEASNELPRNNESASSSVYGSEFEIQTQTSPIQLSKQTKLEPLVNQALIAASESRYFPEMPSISETITKSTHNQNIPMIINEARNNLVQNILKEKFKRRPTSIANEESATTKTLSDLKFIERKLQISPYDSSVLLDYGLLSDYENSTTFKNKESVKNGKFPLNKESLNEMTKPLIPKRRRNSPSNSGVQRFCNDNTDLQVGKCASNLSRYDTNTVLSSISNITEPETGIFDTSIEIEEPVFQKKTINSEKKNKFWSIIFQSSNKDTQTFKESKICKDENLKFTENGSIPTLSTCLGRTIRSTSEANQTPPLPIISNPQRNEIKDSKRNILRQKTMELYDQVDECLSKLANKLHERNYTHKDKRSKKLFKMYCSDFYEQDGLYKYF